MVTKLSEKIGKIITLAEAVRAYWDDELPKRHPDYPLVHPGEDSGPPPPERDQLEDYLKGIGFEDIVIILSIMYIGRGDGRRGEALTAKSLATIVNGLKGANITPGIAISQMMSQSLLGEYLEDGLAELEKGGIDVDTWGLAAPVLHN